MNNIAITLHNFIIENFGIDINLSLAISYFLIALIFWSFLGVIGGLLTFLERRVAGRIQSRIGPNRVGPQGIFQMLADGIKLVLKEDLIPALADKPLFRMAPYLCVIGVFSALVVIPFSSDIVVADLNVGVLYALAITTMVVMGILMGSWASNNKWSLLGGLRSAAQIVSYEIPAALSVLSIVLITGSLSMQDIIRAQGAWPHQWFFFHNPGTFVAFFIFFTSALAENNRVPFDIPEAESELVAGYNTEYSGMRFSFFFLAEFANVFIISSLAVIFFFGGWQIPHFLISENHIITNIIMIANFLFKTFVFIFIVLWLRWTLPRLRVDQLMTMCWKYLIPISFICLCITASFVLFFGGKSMIAVFIGRITQ